MGEIITRTGPNLDNTTKNVKAHLIKSEFDQLVWDNGYSVYHDTLIYCPCKTKDGLFTTNCICCGGTGYVLVHRNETKMVLQGMNYETKFKDWTELKLGMVRITCLQEEDINFMDRIILRESETNHNQIIYPEREGKDIFATLFYEPIQVKDIFCYNGPKKLLKKLETSDYELQDNIIFIKGKFGEDLRISIRYSHRPQFHIIDTQRDIIQSTSVEGGEESKAAKYPTSAIGRRSHYVLDRQNENLTNLDK